MKDINLALNFDATVTNLSLTLNKDGVKVLPFSSPRKFQYLNLEKQEISLKKIKIICDQTEILPPNINDYEKLQIICKANNLEPVDKRVYELLSNDLCWEIIDFELNQLYRSNLIYKLSSYSLEDFETISPWQLFIRPEFILNTLVTATENLKLSNTLLDMSDSISYLAEEALSEKKLQFEFTHKFACPLKDMKSGQNRAFVSAFIAKPIENAGLKIRIFQ